MSVATTDWTAIVTLYDRLMTIGPSPVVALNRAIAIGQRDGADAGIAALRDIQDAERLRRYPFYPAAIAEFELRLGHDDEARRQFTAAARLARSAPERRFLQRRAALATAR